MSLVVARASTRAPTRAGASARPSHPSRSRFPARGLSPVCRSSASGDGVPDPISAREKADAARKALQGALGNKRDVLSKFDGGGKGGGPLDWFFGGGGGDDDGENAQARKIANWVFLAFVVLLLFKPVTAVIVNAVYYAFGWRTGREAPTEAELAAMNAPADASVISKYAADDDDDDDDDEDDA